MLKNIFFDIGMVLVDFCWKDALVKVGCSDEEIERFDKVFFADHLWDELDLGVMKDSEVFEKSFELLPDMADKIKVFWENKKEMIRPYDYSLPMIEELKKRGYKVFLLTNYPTALYKACIDEGRFPFYHLIDGEVVSSHINCMKPNRPIFEEIIKKYNLKADECLFTDDRIVNVEGAKAVGIDAFVFESCEQVMAEITRREC